MTNNVVRYGIVGIAVVLLVVAAFAGVASADNKYIANADEWIANVSNGGFDSTNVTSSDTVYLTGDLDFSGKDQTKIMIESFSGKLDGYWNGVCHTISNFSLGSSSSFEGLICSYSGTRIANLTISNFSVSGSSTRGGLVGYAISTCMIENVIVMNGVFTGSGGDVGGLIGAANVASKEIVNCTVTNCRVSGNNVGGLVGCAGSSSVYVNMSWVYGCEISGSSSVGGFVGYAYISSEKIYLNNSGVVNCVVESSSGYSGGCLGCNSYKGSDVRTIDNCTVRNCAIYASSSSGSSPCGGIIGGCVQDDSPTEYPSVSNCRVEFCTIAGKGTNSVGGIAGTFPTAGMLDRNNVISSCIVSVSGKAAGICPTATTAS